MAGKLAIGSAIPGKIILESISLSRHVDYDIDYDAGTLFFKEPSASRDENFNPIFIVIDYEAQDDRDAAINYGGRGALHIDEGVEVGASYIHEGTSGAEGSLSALDTRIRLGSTELRAEIATSRAETATGDSGIITTTKGDAYLAEVSHHGKDLDGRVYIREQDSGFGLGQQSSSEAGSRKIGIDARYRLNAKFSVAGELSRQSMLDTSAERDLGQVEIKYQEKNYSLRTGLRQSTDNAAWCLDAGLDRSQTLRHPGSTAINDAAPAASGGSEDFTALSFGANRKAEKWTLSNRIEYRTSDSEDKIGLYAGAEGEVRDGLALSGRF